MHPIMVGLLCDINAKELTIHFGIRPENQASTAHQIVQSRAHNAMLSRKPPSFEGSIVISAIVITHRAHRLASEATQIATPGPPESLRHRFNVQLTGRDW